MKTFDEIALKVKIFEEFEYKGYMWLKFSENECAQILDDNGEFKKAKPKYSFFDIWKVL